MPDFVGDVLDVLRDPLAVLCSLRDQPRQRSVLIQINDTGPRELVRFRWQAALRLCEQELVGRPAAVVSVVPELEEVFGRGAQQIR